MKYIIKIILNVILGLTPSIVTFGQEFSEITERPRSSSEIKEQIFIESIELALNDQSSEARDHLKTGILRSNPGTPEWHMRYGNYLVRLANRQIERGRLYDEGKETAILAQEQYEIALRILSPERKFQLSRCYNKIAFIKEHFFGDEKLAIENYQKADEELPGNSSSIRGLRRLHTSISEISDTP